MKTKTFKAPIIMKTIVFILVVGLTTACGGKAKRQKAAAANKTATDITRPPTFVKAEQRPEVETNPNETVSYDEWLKRRGDGAQPIDIDTDSPTEIQVPEELEVPDEPLKIP